MVKIIFIALQKLKYYSCAPVTHLKLQDLNILH